MPLIIFADEESIVTLMHFEILYPKARVRASMQYLLYIGNVGIRKENTLRVADNSYLGSFKKYPRMFKLFTAEISSTQSYPDLLFSHSLKKT